MTTTTDVVSRPPAASPWAAVSNWRELAVRALRRMYLPEQRLFVYELEKGPDGTPRPQGVSGRYTAIALIGLQTEPAEASASIFGAHSREDVCARLVEVAQASRDIGEVGLTLWALRVAGHSGAGAVLERLRAMDPVRHDCPTVELAWCLTALVVPADAPTDAELARAVYGRLRGAYSPAAELFRHWPPGSNAPWGRAHVTCFADWVYPVQAFSYYHRATGDNEAIDIARRAAQRMCDLQGPAGQWWWHYDARNGRVIEGYPVYAIHQDAMGPMALFALEEACGVRHWDAVRKSCEWLIRSPELDGGSLVDTEHDLIWRKVARHEPNKLVRKIQASVSRLAPPLRAPGMDLLFRPGKIDWESRPYHMGWLLHAFPADRVARLAAGG
jgi:hypothetical protein